MFFKTTTNPHPPLPPPLFFLAVEHLAYKNKVWSFFFSIFLWVSLFVCFVLVLIHFMASYILLSLQRAFSVLEQTTSGVKKRCLRGLKHFFLKKLKWNTFKRSQHKNLWFPPAPHFISQSMIIRSSYGCLQKNTKQPLPVHWIFFFFF